MAADSIRLFKLLIRNKGEPSENGLRYILKNIDIINEMGIKIIVVSYDDDDLDSTTVNALKSKGAVKFPALIIDNGKARNGVDDIKDLFERNKRDYNSWIDQRNAANTRKGGREMEPEYSFGGESTGSMVRDFYSKEMTLDAFKRDQKSSSGRDEEGFSNDGDDYNRRIAEQFGRRKIQAPSRANNSFNSGGGNDLDDDMDARRGGGERVRGNDNDDENNIMPMRGYGGGDRDDMFESRFMEGVDETKFID